LVEDEYVQITQPGIRLKVIPKLDQIVVTPSHGDHEGDGEKYSTSTLPKHYRLLYLTTLRLTEKIKRKTIKYTIIRTRELDPTDRVTCYVSCSGSYTLNFNDGKCAFLKNKDHDIKLITHRSTRTVPFQYDGDRLSAVSFDDAYDSLRVVMHETIRCAETIEKQRLKQLNHSKTWMVHWNVDTGSVTDIKHDDAGKHSKAARDAMRSPSVHGRGPGHRGYGDEGLFRCRFDSETTLSSDYSDNNSEISIDRQDLDSGGRGRCPQFGRRAIFKLKREMMALSTVDSSMMGDDTIRSEASWWDTRRCKKRNALRGWTKKNVADWMKNRGISKWIGRVFWKHGVDGKVLLRLDRQRIYKMFDAVHEGNVKKYEVHELANEVLALQRQCSSKR